MIRQTTTLGRLHLGHDSTLVHVDLRHGFHCLVQEPTALRMGWVGILLNGDLSLPS